MKLSYPPAISQLEPALRAIAGLSTVDEIMRYLPAFEAAHAAINEEAKLYLRILRPQWNALLPDTDHLPRSLRIALDQLATEIDKLHQEAAFVA